MRRCNVCDLRNGPPLIRDKPYWEAAMVRAELVLKYQTEQEEKNP